MPEAVQTAYRSCPPDIQNRIRRVCEVWRTRNVFEKPILDAIESRISEIDKSKGSSGKKTLMGNNLFSSSSSTGVPKELETVAPLQIAVTKATIAARPHIDAAQSEYVKITDPDAIQPSPPVYAARLSSLIKSLASAESSLSASIKARQALVSDIAKILEINKSALAKDEETYMEVESRKTSTEAKKREVEDAIMKGLASTDSPGALNAEENSPQAYMSERPEVEELTPEPEDLPLDTTSGGLDYIDEQPIETNPALAAALSGFDNGVTTGTVRKASGSGLNGMSAKRRKMSHDEDNAIPDLGPMENLLGSDVPTADDVTGDLDADVNELLAQEGAKA